MAMTINTNNQSLNAQRNAGNTQSALSTSMQRLSSGLRVNSAKDDSAGLAIAERMNSQVKGMNVAVRNANDGISMAQTAEGALGKVGDSLQRMRELAVQSANGTNTDADKANLQAEFQALNDEITRVTGATSFNGNKLLDGSTASFAFQVGANTDTTDKITVNSVDLSSVLTQLATFAIGQDSTVANGAVTLADAAAGAPDADKAIKGIDDAIAVVTTGRASMGATQNRFESVISNLQVSSENLAASKGRIMDADFATETMNLSRSQILQQAGTAMISQANQLPQQVLSLLR
jgi:flagellin